MPWKKAKRVHKVSRNGKRRGVAYVGREWAENKNEIKAEKDKTGHPKRS